MCLGRLAEVTCGSLKASIGIWPVHGFGLKGPKSINQAKLGGYRVRMFSSLNLVLQIKGFGGAWAMWT